MWKAFDRIQIFLINFVKALRFSVLDYDAKLQVTKTPGQRAVIWTFAAIISLFGAFAILLLIRSIVEPIFNHVFIPNL